MTVSRQNDVHGVGLQLEALQRIPQLMSLLTSNERYRKDVIYFTFMAHRTSILHALIVGICIHSSPSLPSMRWSTVFRPPAVVKPRRSQSVWTSACVCFMSRFYGRDCEAHRSAGFNWLCTTGDIRPARQLAIVRSAVRRQGNAHLHHHGNGTANQSNTSDSDMRWKKSQQKLSELVHEFWASSCRNLIVLVWPQLYWQMKIALSVFFSESQLTIQSHHCFRSASKLPGIPAAINWLFSGEEEMLANFLKLKSHDFGVQSDVRVICLREIKPQNNRIQRC